MALIWFLPADGGGAVEVLVLGLPPPHADVTTARIAAGARYRADQVLFTTPSNTDDSL
jgi:hypothetical protein